MINQNKKHQKVAVIVWTIDPKGSKRFLLRHSKPFDGYEDEWTICFGNLEGGENLDEAAKREAKEEFGITKIEEIKDLNYTFEYTGKYGPTEVHVFAIKIKEIDVPIHLNEESIGYDWTLIDRVKKLMQHDDELAAFDLIR